MTKEIHRAAEIQSGDHRNVGFMRTTRPRINAAITRSTTPAAPPVRTIPPSLIITTGRSLVFSSLMIRSWLEASPGNPEMGKYSPSRLFLTRMSAGVKLAHQRWASFRWTHPDQQAGQAGRQPRCVLDPDSAEVAVEIGHFARSPAGTSGARDLPLPRGHPRNHSIQEAGAVEKDLNQADFAVDRKSTRLNSSHLVISYAVFC